MLTKDDPQYATKLGHLLRQYLIENRAMPSPYLVRDAHIMDDGGARLTVDGISTWFFPAADVRKICERYVEPPKAQADHGPFGPCKVCGDTANHQLSTATVSKYTDGFHGYIKRTIAESDPVPFCERCYQE